LRGSASRKQLCTFLFLPVLWLAASGFQSERPAKPRNSETQVPEAGSKPATKPAWKWTLEERLAARFDPAAMAERQAQYQAEQEAIRKRQGGSLPEDEARVTRSVIEKRDGRRTPELFLPGELFDLLLDGAFAPGRERADLQGSRAHYEQWAAALGLGSNFWERLEEAAAPYLTLLQKGGRQRLPSRADIAAKGEEGRFHICRARLQALEAAGAELGEEAFLRLLYEGVAPSYQEISLYSDYQEKAEDLRLQEGGCR
jgi:hypothetical protein